MPFLNLTSHRRPARRREGLMRPKKLHLLAITLTAGAVLLVAAARGGDARLLAANQETSSPREDLPYDASADGRGAGHIHPGGLTPALRGALRAMGYRLQRPGKERLTLAGTLTLDGQTSAFTLVSEFPGRFRLALTGIGGVRVLVFDKRDAGRPAAEGRDADLLETLVFDAPEHFLDGQARGLAARLIGTRLRDGEGEPEGAGAFHDIYQVADTVGLGRAPRRRSKLYLVNSNTQLLDRVRYEGGSEAEQVRVEIAFEWQQVEGQRVPRRVTRMEDGRTVMTLDVSSATVGPRADDGIFVAAQPR